MKTPLAIPVHRQCVQRNRNVLQCCRSPAGKWWSSNPVHTMLCGWDGNGFRWSVYWICPFCCFLHISRMMNMANWVSRENIRAAQERRGAWADAGSRGAPCPRGQLQSSPHAPCAQGRQYLLITSHTGGVEEARVESELYISRHVPVAPSNLPRVCRRWCLGVGGMYTVWTFRDLDPPCSWGIRPLAFSCCAPSHTHLSALVTLTHPSLSISQPSYSFTCYSWHPLYYSVLI